MTPIMNAQQVAELLECSVRTVEDYARAGKLPGAKFGDGWIFASELVIEAVKRISLEVAEQRTRPKAQLAQVAHKGPRRLPGMAHMSEQAVREILGA